MAIIQSFPSPSFSVPDTLGSLLQLHSNAATHFTFEVPDLKQSYSVLTFSGTDALSSSFRYDVHVRAKSALDAPALLGKDARLEIDGAPARAGLIEAVTYVGPTNDGEEYALTLVSLLEPLKRTQRSRVWVDRSLLEVIDEVLKDHGFAGEKLKKNLKGNYRPFTQVVQYNETDFDFLTRLSSQAGLYWRVALEKDKAQLVLEDDSLSAKPGEVKSLPCRPVTGSVQGEHSVWRVREISRVVSGAARLKDYNPETPEQALLCAAGDDTCATYQYGAHYLTQDEGEAAVKRLKEALAVEARQLVIDTDARGLAPGTLLELTGHGSGSINGKYYILAVKETGDQTKAQAFGAREAATAPSLARGPRLGPIGEAKDAESNLTFKAEVTLLPADVPYRAKALNAPSPSGLQIGQIDSTGGDYAYLDDQGRYRLKLKFDLEDHEKAQGSAAARLATPLSGNQYGLHFPLHEGTEVLWLGLNGDLNRPVILAAAPNPSTPSPVTSANHSQNILRTFGANELVMEDLKGQERIELSTRDKQNYFKLDADEQGHNIQLKTEQGKQEHSCAKTYAVESGDSYTLQSGNNQEIEVENKYQLQTKNQDIALSAGTDIHHTAKDNVRLHAEEQNIEQAAQADHITEAQNDASLRTVQGNLDLISESAQLSAKASGNVTIIAESGDGVTIKSGGATIQCTSGGEVAIKATNITLEGTNINIKGAQVGNN